MEVKKISILRYFLILFLFITGSISSAQTSETIQTGRPGQSIGTNVVGSGIFQVQSGVDYSTTINNQESNSLLLNNVIRLGLSESFELSGVFNLQEDQVRTTHSTLRQSGISAFHLGFRYNLIESPEGFKPAIGIQSRFKLTNVSNAYRTNHVAPTIIVASNFNLSNNSSLTFNAGLDYDGVGAAVTYLWTLSYSYSITDTWGTFVEGYGNEKSGTDKLYIDSGLSYLVNKDMQLDISAGWGNNLGFEESFVSLGISWRNTLF